MNRARHQTEEEKDRRRLSKKLFSLGYAQKMN